jgi:hypothetical protein
MNRISRFFSSIASRIDVLTGRHDVENVLGSVHKTIAKLEASIAHHAEQEYRHLEAERIAYAAKIAAIEQRVKANKLVTRIRALID